MSRLIAAEAALETEGWRLYHAWDAQYKKWKAAGSPGEPPEIVATITAGWGPDGKVAVGRAGGVRGGCAEDHVASQLGVDVGQICFTKARRPRNWVEVPVCKRCQKTYRKDQFPPDTAFA